MSEALEHAESLNSSPDRRKHARQRVRSITYVDLDQGNGGIILDASETGMSVQAVVSLMDDELPKVRMKLPHSKEWIETRAQIAWTRDSRKVVGLQFLDLPDEARDHIKEWLLRDASDAETKAESSAEPSPNAAEPSSTGATALQEIDNGEIQPEPAEHNTELPKGDLQTENVSRPGEKSKSIASIFSAFFSRERNTLQTAEPSRKPSTEARAQRSNVQTSATEHSLDEESHRLALIYLLLVVLALLSLTTGWAAGSGKFGPLLRKLRGVSAQTGVEGRTLTGNIQRQAVPVKFIEVVDASNRRWMIPLQAALHYRKPTPVPAQPAQANSSAPDSQSALNFHIWTLSAPKRNASSSAADAMGNNDPPAIAEQPSAPQIAPPSRLAVAATAVPLPIPQTQPGELKRGELLHRVEPIYPEVAKQAHVSGTVVLNATISPDGAVRNVKVISGPKLLTGAAINAVRQWRYAPTLLNGKPVEAEVKINLVFQLTGNR